MTTNDSLAPSHISSLGDIHRDRLSRVRLDRFTGALLGTACGDAMGLAVEGQAPSAGQRHADRLALALARGDDAVPYFAQRFSGRYSDDTQQARVLVEVLAQHGYVNQDEFARRLAEVVRGGRDHGWGAATLGAVRRMVGGMPWREAAASSGQCGNGTVMRVVPVGAWFAEAPDVVVAGQAERQSRVTHADDHCAAAAILVALAAADAVRVPTRHVLARTPEWARHVEPLDRVLARGVAELPQRLQLSRQDAVCWAAEHAPGTRAEVMGVPGTAGATALFALWCWLRTPRAFMPAVLEAISAGGDTDTVAAVVGGLVGATTGARRLPRFFTHRLRDVPHWRAEHLALLCEEAWRRHRLIP